MPRIRITETSPITISICDDAGITEREEKIRLRDQGDRKVDWEATAETCEVSERGLEMTFQFQK